jgi:S-adenosylmethionine hydrolase
VINLKLKNHILKLKFCKAYADATLHEPVALIGSHGFLEIAVDQGSAAERFGVKPADKIVIMRES